MSDDPRQQIFEMIQARLQQDDYTGWFEDVYRSTQAGQFSAPWSTHTPHPHLMSWFERETPNGTGHTALVAGCGEGDDAEYLAQHGYTVTAFDIAETAIQICEQRFPDSSVTYQVADLFALPEAWLNSFDFVLDNRTVQSLPPHLTEAAIRAQAATVAPGGTLLILCSGRDDDEPREGVPWPLSHQDLNLYVTAGLTEVRFEDLTSDDSGGRRFRVTYTKPDTTEE